MKILNIFGNNTRTYFVTTNGVYVEGRNTEGDLGLGDSRPTPSPRKLSFFDKISVKQIVCSTNNLSFFVTEKGIFYTGRLMPYLTTWADRMADKGPADLTPRPFAITNLPSSIAQVALADKNGSFFCLSQNGTLFLMSCDAGTGSLALGQQQEEKLHFAMLNATQQYVPKLITVPFSEKYPISKMFIFDGKSFFLSNGKLYGCGWNKYGSLGVGSNSEYIYEPKPVQKIKEHEIHSVVCDDASTVFHTSKGLFVAGYKLYKPQGLDDQGQLTDNEPHELKSFRNSRVVSIVYGKGPTFLVLTTAGLFEFGRPIFEENGGPYYQAPSEITFFATHKVEKVFCFGTNSIWVITDQGLFRPDHTKKTWASVSLS